MVGTVVSTLFLELTSSSPSGVRAATIRILQMRKQPHKFSWLESGGSSGLCDVHEQHHCAPGAMRGHTFVPFLWILFASDPPFPFWWGDWRV